MIKTTRARVGLASGMFTGEVCWLSAEDVTADSEWLHCIDATCNSKGIVCCRGKGIIACLSGCLCVVLADVSKVG